MVDAHHLAPRGGVRREVGEGQQRGPRAASGQQREAERDGGGPEEYFDWIRDWTNGTMEARLREHFTVPGYIFLLNCEQAKRYNILMLTSVPAETVAPMGLKAFSDVESLMKCAQPEGKKIYVIPNGSTVVPHVKGEE